MLYVRPVTDASDKEESGDLVIGHPVIKETSQTQV
jgi:hypothetical protein